MDFLACKYGWSSCLLKLDNARLGQGCPKAAIFSHLTHNGGMICDVATNLHGLVPVRSTLVIPSRESQLESRTIALPTRPLRLDSFKVTGGHKLSGHVHISGAKNSALAVLAGSLCSSEDVFIRGVPNLLDIERMLQVLKSVGVCLSQCGSDVCINARNLGFPEPCEETVQKIRAGFFVIGALVARHGEAILALPGGCAIGSRPIDLHVRGLEALGAKVEVRQGKVHTWIPGNRRKLKGGTFHFDFPSVGASETLMMAACLAEGNSVLSNVAKEPEVVDLANFLIACGAKIEGAGTSKLVIKGVKQLHGTEYTIIPDRIEAGTYLIAAAITHSTIYLSPVMSSHLTAVINNLRSMGCQLHQQNAVTLQISSCSSLRGLDVATGPYPSYPTDLQPQLMSLMTNCHGRSLVMETVFESRMGHVKELQKFGAKIDVVKNRAVIRGSDMGSSLVGAHVNANDLRAGSALILAGMAAQGVTHIKGASHVDRGYESFDEKLRMLGASIERLP